MILYEISIVLLFEFLYGICQIYSISTKNISKNLYRQTQEQFATVFFFIYSYIVNAVIIFFILYLTHSRRCGPPMGHAIF